MFTYWLNRALWGTAPLRTTPPTLPFIWSTAAWFSSCFGGCSGWAGWGPVHRKRGAVLGATLFLIHPLQTESVSYIAGRSESLSALFLVLLAYTLFLYRRKPAISWIEALARPWPFRAPRS